MARFAGEIGYAEQVETKPGVFQEVITEYKYYGDVTRNARQLVEGENIHSDISVNNTISILADAYAREHFHAIRYVKWSGVLWSVADVTVKHPRLLLRLGGVYSGSRA